MAVVTIVVANLMLVLGIVGYIGTGMEHVTALIPAIFGAVLEGLGLLGLVGPAGGRKHFMHAAMLIGLLGFLGTARAIGSFVVLMQGGEVSRPEAVPYKAAMAVICVVYLALGIRSFIVARLKPATTA